jgi:SulP family sulfate permease
VVRSVLAADGVVDLIGLDHIHGNVHRAVEAALRD